MLCYTNAQIAGWNERIDGMLAYMSFSLALLISLSLTLSLCVCVPLPVSFATAIFLLQSQSNWLLYFLRAHAENAWERIHVSTFILYDRKYLRLIGLQLHVNRSVYVIYADVTKTK